MRNLKEQILYKQKIEWWLPEVGVRRSLKILVKIYQVSVMQMDAFLCSPVEHGDLQCTGNLLRKQISKCSTPQTHIYTHTVTQSNCEFTDVFISFMWLLVHSDCMHVCVFVCVCTYMHMYQIIQLKYIIFYIYFNCSVIL